MQLIQVASLDEKCRAEEKLGRKNKEDSIMNNMDKVWKMLSLDIFEKFNIIDTHNNALTNKIDGKINNPYYFQDEGIVNSYGVLDNHKLAGLITGYYGIEKI